MQYLGHASISGARVVEWRFDFILTFAEIRISGTPIVERHLAGNDPGRCAPLGVCSAASESEAHK